MAVLAGLSSARAILLATELCASGNVAPLPQLQSLYPVALPLERLLRIILTFLPESLEPKYYTSVLQELVDGTPSPVEDNIDVSSVKSLSDPVARKRVRKLRLLPLNYHGDDNQDSTDPLTQFLIHRAHLIDSETALQPLILDLLLPFYQRSPFLRTWLISNLLPLLRLNYEYYPSNDEIFTLDMIESMDDETAINVLLSMASPQADSMDLVNNLRGLVGPWVRGSSHRSKRRKLNEAAGRNSISLPKDEVQSQTSSGADWQCVNEWLLLRSLVDHDSVVSAFTRWDGPEDVDLGGYEESQQRGSQQIEDLRFRYGQSGLAVIYANGDPSKPALEGSMQIITRISKLLDIDGSSFISRNTSELLTVTFAADPISSTSRASLLQNNLLSFSNPLTNPSPSSITFLSAILLSLQTLNELGHQISCRAAANICLHSNEEMQFLELRSVVASITKQTRSGRNWKKIRHQLLWLRDWQVDHLGAQTDRPSYHGLYWRVPHDLVETEILKALLEARAVDIFIDQSSTPLQLEQVEGAVKDAIFTAYDNASNGNKTRGGMKRAYDILQAFQPHFPGSISFKQINALISATHALSFYSLTLQHGVPFQPVSIRVHSDPLSLIEKVLDQNSNSYTKLDDLLSIGRNMVAAGFPPSVSNDDSHYEQPPSPSEDATVTAERRIISLAISSALSYSDFGTAYSYILTRLTPPTHLPTSSPADRTIVKDDISWRAVYNAGRYRSSSPPTSNLQSQITQLSQRMELLSLALVLAPTPDPLPEILGAWRRCDEEMNNLRTRESEEEDLWDTKGDNLSSVPGGFGPTDSEQDAFETKQQHAKRARARQQGRSDLEEAPMGLFEVARGAALALQKNAFPLHGAATSSDHTSSSHTPDHVDDASAEDRVRKRDVVSNMVTGGLASGIGWVLGAQPVNR